MKNRTIILIGCGTVGTSFVYAAINQGLAQDYILIDVNKNIAEGHALDLNDCNAVLERPFNSVRVGNYSDCKDAEMIVLTAGRPQKPGESRLEMVVDNALIMKDIALKIKESGFSGVTIIGSNPVDVLTTVYQQITGFDPHTIVGTGTSLDSARLQRLVGEKLKIHPASIHTYIMGEHGDSSMVAWSCGTIMGKRIIDYLDERMLTLADLEECKEEAINMAYKIIKKKGATFYGIGVVLANIAGIILRGENQAAIIGAYLNGEYGQKGFYTGVPVVLSNNGWDRIITLKINASEQLQFEKSCQTIKDTVQIAFEAIEV